MPDNTGKQSRTAGTVARPAQPAGGRLVVVTCADAGRLEVLLRAATCHLGAKLSAEMVLPLATCRLASGSGTPVKPSHFCKLAGKGGLLISWREGQHLYGYPSSVLERLGAGFDVVIGAPAHLEPQLRALWPETILIRLAAGTEPLRQLLSPHATFARAAAKGTRHGLTEPIHAAACDARVEDSRDPALAVRRLAGAIANGLPIRQPEAALASVARVAPGDPVRLELARAGKLRAAAKVPPARRRAQRSIAPALV